MEKDSTQRYKSERHIRRARIAKRDKRAQVRKGIGACIFTLGIPLAIAGSIILIVSNTKTEENEVPPSFKVLGPVLVFLSVTMFAVGSVMTDMISLPPCVSLCFPDDPKSFCWRRCPGLFTLLRPADVLLIKQREACLHALQSVPSKPALKKPVATSKPTSLKRGVRFSDSDPEPRPGTLSTSSEHSETGRESSSTNTSLLSLRHCKIHPKEGEMWGSATSDPSHGSHVLEDSSVVVTLSGCVDNNDLEVFADPAPHLSGVDECTGSPYRGCDGNVYVTECEHL